MDKREIISYLKKNDVDLYRLSIISKLLNNDIDINIIENIHNNINKNHNVIKSFIHILKNVNNIHDIGITQIENILYSYNIECSNSLIHSIINNKLDFKDLVTININNINFFRFNSILDENISKDLYNIHWTGIGKGEVLLCMILENAISNTYKRGDILIDDNTIEVKSYNSKLLNQSDFANGEEVSNYWIDIIQKHPKIKDLKKDHNNNKRWNLTKDNNYLSYYVDLLLENEVDVNEISDIICSGWDKLFMNDIMDRTCISNILEKYNSLKGEAFNYYVFEIFLHNMIYYLKSSEIDYIALTSKEGFYIFDKDFFLEDRVKLKLFFDNNFSYKYPSLTKKSSSGRVFSISLLEG